MGSFGYLWAPKTNFEGGQLSMPGPHQNACCTSCSTWMAPEELASDAKVTAGADWTGGSYSTSRVLQNRQKGADEDGLIGEAGRSAAGVAKGAPKNNLDRAGGVGL